MDRYKQAASSGYREIHTIFPVEFEQLFVGIPLDILATHLNEEECGIFLTALNNIENIKINPGKRNYTIRILLRIFQTILNCDHVLSSLQADKYCRLIVYILFDYLYFHQALSKNKLSNHERVLRRTLELIIKSQGQISLEELSREAFASRRTIQYAFSNIIHTSPIKYAKLHRLNLFREELILHKNRQNLGSLFSKYSISNSGRFSKEYEEYFGERLIETIQRNQMQDDAKNS